MENRNTPKRKGSFQINPKDFFEAWKKTCKKRLEEVFDMHVEECLLIGCEPMDYDEYCVSAYDFDPKAFEHRDN